MPPEIGDGAVLEVEKPHRVPWNGFPDVVITTNESAVKRHAEYEEAKTGEVPAAKRLAAQLA